MNLSVDEDSCTTLLPTPPVLASSSGSTFFLLFFFFFAEAVELSRLEGCQRSIRFARRMVKGFGLCVSLIRIAYSLLLGRVSI